MTGTNLKRRRLPEHIAEAMSAILDFFWQSEASHYVCGGSKGQDEHIFIKMMMVRQWLLSRQEGKQGGK